MFHRFPSLLRRLIFILRRAHFRSFQFLVTRDVFIHGRAQVPVVLHCEFEGREQALQRATLPLVRRPNDRLDYILDLRSEELLVANGASAGRHPLPL